MNIENTINDKDFFNPDNFTEKKNPLLASLYNVLQCETAWGTNSEECNRMLDNTCSIMDSLAENLGTPQRKVLNELYDHLGTCSNVSDTENFIRGFKLAIRLMQEGLTV